MGLPLDWEGDEEGLELKHVADTIHFADSKDSWGIQLADCCAFFLKRHFIGLQTDDFLSIFRDQIVAKFECL